MNTAKLKTYAPRARRDFIAAVTARAHLLGISEKNGQLDIAPNERTGDIVLIAGQAWPAKVHQQRERLILRIEKESFAHIMEAVAYTWFNRFAALRYMELHDYLNHGYRVLSSREGGLPEILTHASELAAVLPGLNASQVAELKIAGDKDGELYRLLLVAQCNALSSAMPFLFERIEDESELLLPDNLIRTDSLIRSLVEEIPEADWAEIEIIGWLYQFYISERKDQVIGKVVASEDIPAATQLFTPNWIVKYMVQNSLGAQWLATYPDSPLKAHLAYYIEPAEQTAEVKAQLAAVTPSDLNPEELTLIDPACGSGHILVEAYELFKAIYLERGYRQRDVAQLILEKNVFGLDIDVRAAQLTGFALMMKGRADDRRLFERKVELNVMALGDSAGFDGEVLASGVKLTDYGLQLDDLTELKRLFEHATDFGSLIQVPEDFAQKIPMLKLLSEAPSQDLFVVDELKRLGALVKRAHLLAAKYDAVVANPPYMGSTGMNANVKKFVKDWYADAHSDLFACFIRRGCILASTTGRTAMVTMDSWMFLSSFTKLRESLLREHHTESLVHVGWNCFPEVHTYHRGVAFVLRNDALELAGNYQNLSDVPATVNKNELFLARLQAKAAIYRRTATEFEDIPGSPLAYWLSDAVRAVFRNCKSLGEVADAAVGLQTGDNGRFLRFWFEVSDSNIARGCRDRTEAIESQKRWFPSNKGGAFRKWYGNHEFVLDWQDDGREIRNFVPKSVIRNPHFYFRESVSWSDVTSGLSSFRVFPQGFIHDAVGHSAFGGDEDWKLRLVAYCNTKFFGLAADLINPTIHFHIGYFNKLPLAAYGDEHQPRTLADACVSASKVDWNAYERSWGFQSLPILTASSELAPTLESSYNAWISDNRDTIAEMKRLEEENNRLFINAYALADELTPDVPIEQITLTVNPVYRYGGGLTEEEQWTRFRQDTMAELVSYAIGCMMGRYSLDEPGLIYAHAGNVGFDALRYKSFPADADGIAPVTDELWFEDDAANRVCEFLRATWGAERLNQNVAFLAANLGAKGNETPAEVIRRYLASKFFKDHLQTYKKRPIYWLFSSGKEGAFQALVYLHRYHKGTLARMRTEYVVPLTGKMQSRIEMLEKDRDAASSTAARNKIAKQIDSLKKKHVELLAYDEKLRHYADMRISLDLDDGVKVNYGKFGDLLAEVKAVTGGASDE